MQIAIPKNAAALLSPQYCAAMSAALIEYTARQLILGSKANANGLARAGLIMVVTGEAMRKAAMVCFASHCNSTF